LSQMSYEAGCSGISAAPRAICSRRTVLILFFRLPPRRRPGHRAF